MRNDLNTQIWRREYTEQYNRENSDNHYEWAGMLSVLYILSIVHYFYSRILFYATFLWSSVNLAPLYVELTYCSANLSIPEYWGITLHEDAWSIFALKFLQG
jgi:hypothetical protein